jgi:4'-phosphopantetheinyl transferase EntD
MSASRLTASVSDAGLACVATTLRQWLPGGFVLVSAHADARLPVPEADSNLMTSAVATRRADFVGGRWCAHRALEEIGHPAHSLPIGPLHAPIWPPGVIGSITHDRGWCMAVAGLQKQVSGIGIDLCAHAGQRALQDLAPLICSRFEFRALPAVSSPANVLALLFCIKEAVVKAVSRTAQRYLELREIEVRILPSRFEATVADLPVSITGRHAWVMGDVVAMATTTPRADGRLPPSGCLAECIDRVNAPGNATWPDPGSTAA